MELCVGTGETIQSHDHATATDIDVVLEHQGDRLWTERLRNGPVESPNLLHRAHNTGGKRQYLLPNFDDAARDLSAESAEIVELVMAHFRSPALRLYGSNDVVGVELGGALKNIIAIAAGVVEGLGLGHNALAALITRGLAELSRVAVAQGGQRDTLAGLAGLGDLVLTCTGDLSRNRRVGIALAKGQSLADILAATKMVAEGVRTTAAALELSKRHGIELPIASEMAAVLAGHTDPQTAIRNLMGRKQKLEHA